MIRYSLSFLTFAIALSAAVSVPPRSAARVSPPDPVTILTAASSLAEINSARLFREPLVAIGHTPTSAEVRALATALMGFVTGKDSDDLSGLRAFARSSPSAPFRVSLQVQLGSLLYNRGYYSLAIEAWEDAWSIGRDATKIEERSVVDRAIGELIKMNARLGRQARVKALLEEVAGRPLHGGADQLVAQGRHGLWLMENQPGDSFRCGPVALDAASNLLAAPRFSEGKTKVLRSTPEGTSLAQLSKLAQDLDIRFQPAFRSKGAALVLPAVVHWKLDHYASIVAQADAKYVLKDPTFGNDTHMTMEAIDHEASGYFMVPSGPLPAGWRVVGADEAGTVWGKGQSVGSDATSTTVYNHKVGGDCNNKGMPTYQFHTMLASLTVSDTPVFVASRTGMGEMRFTITYNQKEDAVTTPTPSAFGNLGSKWTHNWTGYLTEKQATPADIMLHPRGGRHLELQV